MVRSVVSTVMRVKRAGTLAFWLGAVLVAASISVLASEPASARATFTVNSTGDLGDPSLNGGCDVNPFQIGPQCTLRAAIEEANVTADPDTINFNIGGQSAVKTFSPNSALPAITKPVTIDGYTQGSSTADPSDDAKPNELAKGTNAILKIELNGTNAGQTAVGLLIRASNTVVKGLVVNRFYTGIQIREASGCRVRGNFIGSDPGGTLDRGNSAVGVAVNAVSSDASDNIIGGASPEARNLISGNGSVGATIQDPSAAAGVATGNAVRGNLIGTEKDGTSALGNSLDGVYVLGASDNTVGGGTSADANTIAFNGRDGVRVASVVNTALVPKRIEILRNSIHSNSALGINLMGGTETLSGQTENDPDDPDTGPNNLQNYPVITSAATSEGTTTITAKLNSTPGKTFTIQFFSNVGPPAEGEKFIGQKSVSTNANGNTGTFTFTPNQAVPVGRVVTATATSTSGNTSEFSAGTVVS